MDNLTQGVPELAKNSSFSFHLEGWPAAAALFSISFAVVAVYAIKTMA
ncbi:MAG: hypothetical protein LUI39_13210 [Lachnospiraceae bacterium]|nr:hypothetical protein [Lachnospiraceae bacterium]